MEGTATSKEELTNIAVIMLKDLPVKLTGNKDAVISAALEQQYRVMKQNLGKVFTAGDGVKEVATIEDLVAEANRLRAKGFKVIILDDGSLSQNLVPDMIKGKIGDDYCVIASESIENLDISTIPFINLNVMALMGVAVLQKHETLFKFAYHAFTGNDAPQELVQNVMNRVMWIIRALPRIARFNIDDISVADQIRRIFGAAA